jgi:hypothetical protein
VTIIQNKNTIEFPIGNFGETPLHYDRYLNIFIQKEKVVIENDYATDFAIITLCDAAILSPSSFSWWGSYMMKKRDIFFAPKHWLGWKSKIDVPNKPLAHYMEPIDINEFET